MGKCLQQVTRLLLLISKNNLAFVVIRIPKDGQVVTMFSESYTPINCRSSIEGVFQFTYQDR